MTGRKATCQGRGGCPQIRHIAKTHQTTNKNTRKPKPKNPKTHLPNARAAALINNPSTNQKSPGKSNSLSLIQINLKKKKNAWGTLVSNISNKINPIILATEPYANTNNLLPKVHKNLVQYYCKDGLGKPRAAILTHKCIDKNCWELKQFTTPDQVAIKIKHDSKEFILASAYMDITNKIPPPQVEPLINYANSCKLPLIIGSDTNAQHKLWGNKACNGRGEELLDFLTNFGLTWSNKGSIPTFINSRGHESIIDLTITNNLGGDLIGNWKVDLNFSNSDHRYITFDITSTNTNNPRQIRQTNNTDWKQFEEYLEQNQIGNIIKANNLNTYSDLDEAALKLNSHLRKAFEHACPITYISSTIKKPPWLTPEVEEAQKGMKRKLMLARANKKDEDWTALRESNKTYNKLHTKTKQREWRAFCKKTETIKESARMHKIIKSCSDNKEKLESVYKSDNTLTENAEETLEEMEKTHFKKDPHANNITNKQHINPDPNIIDKIYNPKRLEDAIMSFDPLKAAGPDTLKPIIIQKAWHSIKDVTRDIMIKCHEKQHIPKPWQESNGIFLPKPGKTDYNKPNSYRIITLSPVLLKLQEKAILWHMHHDLGMEESLSKKQFGFKKGTSTETALHKVIHTIEKRIAKKGFVLGTFLDIEGAFDNVSFDAISEAINNSPVDPTTSGWITNMVTNRYVTITHKNATRRIRVKRGCPQGGILSPFLWNLVIDDLLNYSVNLIPGYLQAFADDLITLAEGDDIDTIWQRTQKTIKTIEDWCLTKGLSISTLKTKIVMFTWNRKWTIRPIKVGGTPITLSNEVKLLGVTLDNKLNFNSHIEKTTNKCIGILMQCKRAIGPTWGLSPKVCKWIYTAIVRPTLTYSAVIWIRALNNKNNLRRLERVQGMALKIMSGALPTTPFNALNFLTNTTNISDFLKGEAAKGAVRLQGYNNWTIETAPTGKGLIKAHSTISNDFLKNLNLPHSDLWDTLKPCLVLDKNYSIITPDIDNIDNYKSNLENNINRTSIENICCYSDGSSTDQGVGGGFVITDNTTPNEQNIIKEYCFKLKNYCSVFQAEVTAIHEGAKFLSDSKDRIMTFWTDSLSALQALSNKLHRNKTVRNCHNALNKLASNNKVYLRWIPAHAGHWGNEKADTLAKAGTSCDNLITSYMPQSHIKTEINNKVKILDKAHWTNNKHKHTTFILGSHSTNIIKTLNNDVIKNKTRYRTAIHLITGHAGLNKHLHTMTLSNTAACPYCDNEEETVSHFIGQCPAFMRLRGIYFNSYYCSVNDIFDNNNINTIITYTHNTKRFLLAEDTDDTGVT